MKYLPFMFISAVFFIPALSIGFGYYDSITNGSPVPGLTPVSAALGNSRAISLPEAGSVFTNPAQLAGLPMQAQGSMAIMSWKERVIENAYVFKLRTLNGNDYLTGAFTMPAGPLNIAAGFAKVAEFGYEGTHEVYQGSELIGVSVLYADGGQYEGVVGAAARITESLSAGVSAGMRLVSGDFSYFYSSHDEDIPDSASAWTVDENEFAWHAGLYSRGGIFTSGLSYSSKTEHMDDVINLGVSAFAAHINNVTVGFEGELASPFDGNRFQGRLSVVMPLRSNLNALTAVTFDDQRVANRAGFGYGLGFQWYLGNIELDGGMYSAFRSRRNTAFPDEENDRVDDGAATFRMGVGYTFDNI